MDKKQFLSLSIIIVVGLIALIVGLVALKVLLEKQNEVSAEDVTKKYAYTAFDALEKTIEVNNCRIIIVPFSGYKSVDVKTLNDYNGSENSDERYFEDCLYERFFDSKEFTLVTRDKLNKALEELTLQAKDIFDPSTAKRLGKFMGVDLLIITEGYIGKGAGSLNIGSGSVRVKCSLIDVETAEIKAMWNRFDRMPFRLWVPKDFKV